MNRISPSLIDTLITCGVEYATSPDDVLDALSKNDIYYPDTDSDGSIRYIRERQIRDFFEAPDLKEYHKTKGQKIKPGKFLTKIDQYDYDRAHKLQVLLLPPEIMTLKGQHIPWAYDVKNNVPNSGSLSSSCMRDSSMSHFFKLYMDNAKMVTTLVDKKISARALVWEDVQVEEDLTLTIMDRIYGNPKEVEALKAYALSQGWFYKEDQSYFCDYIENGKRNYDLKHAVINLKKPSNFRLPQPYFDTFFAVKPDSEGYFTQLRNNENCYDSLSSLSLRSTSGGSQHFSTCSHCGKVIEEKHRSLCDDCLLAGTTFSVCPICGEKYIPRYAGAPHEECIPKMIYKCTDCNVMHIASTQEEFDNKSCKGTN